MENNGKNNNILPLVVIFVVIAALIGGAYWFGKSSIMQNSQKEKISDVKESTEPETKSLEEPEQSTTEPSENIEKNELGEETAAEEESEEEPTAEEPLIEEDSDEAVIESLKLLFAQKYEKRIEDITVSISKREGDYLTGGVKFAGEIAGGYVLAAKVNDAWKIIFDGNGTWTCDVVDVVDFPSTLAPECWDEDTMTVVDRTAE